MSANGKISSGRPWEASIGYSRATVAGPHVFVSGSTATVDGTLQHEGDAYRQTLVAFDVILKALEEAGHSLEDIVRTRMYLANSSDMGAVGRALEDAVVESLNSVLAEDIRDVLMVDSNGKPCIETKTTLDLEHALGLPGGNIFHAPLSWPFVSDDSPLLTPAERWGVDSGEDGIYFCGSTARRGGAVSGIGGHNAAMAVLESD